MIHEAHPARIFSHCPHCGKSGFSFNGKNAFNCPECGLRFYINEATAVAAIIEAADRKILLIRRGRDPAAGTLDLPGGFVDIGESAEDAVRREVLEELGVKVEEACFMASFPNRYEYKGVLYFTCDVVFICHVGDISAISSSEEARELLWVRPEEVEPGAIGFPSIRNAVRMYAEMPAFRRGGSGGERSKPQDGPTVRS
jgi:NAD+ diphosphatase